MKSLTVEYSAMATSQLTDLRLHIEAESGIRRATSFVDRLIDYCNGLSTFPERGTRRDDITPGLRLLGFRRRATIAFTVEPHAVVVQGIFYGGQDVEAAFGQRDAQED